MEYRRIHQGLPKEPPQAPRAKKAKTKLPTESDAKYSLTELLQVDTNLKTICNFVYIAG